MTHVDVATAPHVLREYALIADGERGALVGPRGDIAWMCVPRWDGDAVFSALSAARRLRGHPRTTRYRVGRLLRGRHADLAQPLGHRDRHRRMPRSAGLPGRPAPGGPAAPSAPSTAARSAVDAATARRLRPHGAARPAPRRRRDVARPRRRSALALDRRAEAPAPGPATRRPALTHTVLDRRTQHDLVFGDQRPRRCPTRARRRTSCWRATEAAWADRRPVAGRAARRHATPAAPTRCCAASPAPAAAWSPRPPPACPNGPRPGATTTTATCGSATSATPGRPSPPPAATRCSTTPSVSSPPGCSTTGRRSRPPTPSPAARCPTRRQLALPGYPGGADLVGNRVNHQFQLDAFGEALLLFAAAARHGRLDTDRWQRRRSRPSPIAAALAPSPTPASGSSTPRHWTHCRLTCAAGLRGVAAAAPPAAEAAAWSLARRRHPRRDRRHCLHPDGRWQRAPDDPGVDAALLLPRLRGALPADDPRTTATLRAYPRNSRATTTPTASATTQRPLGRRRGRLPACGFLMALAAAPAGQPGRGGAAGSNATAPPADRPACSPRNTTSPSASCAATCPRRSSTPSCSKPR